MRREKKMAKGKEENVDSDRHVYEKSQEEATSTSKRKKLRIKCRYIFTYLVLFTIPVSFL